MARLFESFLDVFWYNERSLTVRECSLGERETVIEWVPQNCAVDGGGIHLVYYMKI